MGDRVVPGGSGWTMLPRLSSSSPQAPVSRPFCGQAKRRDSTRDDPASTRKSRVRQRYMAMAALSLAWFDGLATLVDGPVALVS